MLKLTARHFLPAIALAAIMPLNAWAGFFGDHPRYMHALSDLRAARSFINRPDAPNVAADDSQAVHELDASIGEIKQAAADDWKDIFDPPHIDAHLDRHGRLAEAMKLMERAHGDMAKEEDDHHARGLRDRAIRHLDIAMQCVRNGMADQHMDKQIYGHP